MTNEYLSSHDGDSPSARPNSDQPLQQLADGVARRDANAEEKLCRLLHNGLRLILLRRAGGDNVDDILQDTLVDVISAIKGDKIRNAQSIVAYARVVAVRKSADLVSDIVRSIRTAAPLDPDRLRDPGAPPDQQVEFDQRVRLMTEQLRRMRPKDREILERFYIHAQPPEQILAEMQITETQFRLRKSRAKVALAALVRKRASSTGVLRRRIHAAGVP